MNLPNGKIQRGVRAFGEAGRQASRAYNGIRISMASHECFAPIHDPMNSDIEDSWLLFRVPGLLGHA